MSYRILVGVLLCLVAATAARASVTLRECGGAVSESNGKILVAEDESAVASLIVIILKGMNYEAKVAKSNREAEAHLAANEFVAAFIDVNLGADDGIALARALRAKGIATMLMSGAHDTLPTVEGLSSLAKPFNLFQFKAAVQKLIPPPETSD